MTKTTTNPKWEEIILVASRKEVFKDEVLAFQGVEQDPDNIDLIVNNLANNLQSMRRGALNDPTSKENNAEINTDFKQPIPYIMISRGDKIFVYERLSQGGESRLHNKLSLGVGGHMNPEEGDFDKQLFINMNRELEEELIITTTSSTLVYTGLINDDENEVGRVHLGILGAMVLPINATVEVREVDQLRGFWLSIDDLKKPEIYDRLESWSQIAVDTL